MDIEKTIRRIGEGSRMPEVPGQGSVFMIPADLMPEGFISGERLQVILDGFLSSSDESGGTVQIDRILFKRLNEMQNRADPIQQRIEIGLKEEEKKSTTE